MKPPTLVQEALDTLKRALALNPNYLPTHLFLAVIFSELGQEEEARTGVWQRNA